MSIAEAMAIAPSERMTERKTSLSVAERVSVRRSSLAEDQQEGQPKSVHAVVLVQEPTADLGARETARGRAAHPRGTRLTRKGR